MHANQSNPSFSLTGQSSDLVGQVFTGFGNQVIIGREADCQVQINASGISRHHARISYINGQWVIEDLQSANGTFVNGQRIHQPQPLQPSDTVGLASVNFTFGSSAWENRSPPAPVMDTTESPG